ncbi:MAG: hypothetical protein AAGI92_00910 [Pseudomonadota bacterium]
MTNPSKLALATLAVAAFAGSAHASTMSGSEIKSAINGKRIYLATPFGGEFPLYYQRNGAVSGDGTALGLGRFFAPKETGKWFIQGNELCQQFPTWYKGQVSCFTLRKTGENRLRWRRDDGESGRARIGS